MASEKYYLTIEIEYEGSHPIIEAQMNIEEIAEQFEGATAITGATFTNLLTRDH